MARRKAKDDPERDAIEAWATEYCDDDVVMAAVFRVLREHAAMADRLEKLEEVARCDQGELFWQSSGTRVDPRS